MNDVMRFLANALKKSFGGQSTYSKVLRGKVTFESGHFEENGSVYHDEWTGVTLGGGQELVQVGEQKYTRVYAGGNLDYAQLEKLGTLEGEVIGYLKKVITTIGEQIRLDKDVTKQSEGDWAYEYKIFSKETAIPLIVGREAISFKNTEVFIHFFLLCPVK